MSGKSNQIGFTNEDKQIYSKINIVLQVATKTDETKNIWVYQNILISNQWRSSK